MKRWTLIVDVPDAWGDPDELAELLRQIEVEVREIHFEDLLDRREIVADLQQRLRSRVAVVDG